MRLSLDTNVLIDLINHQRPEVRAAYEAAVARDDQIFVSALAAHELRFGAALSLSPQSRQAVERTLSGLEIVPFTDEDGAAAAGVRADLERLGQRIGAIDALIAGQAINRGWSVVTANVREFGRVAGLGVIDWTSD